MENEVKISVVMSVYNAERFLKEAIDSILAQTFEDFEFIIIDDGSADSSKAIILSYKDSRIRLIVNPENKGLAYSLNTGLTAARGKYIVRMDADDIALPYRLERQSEFMESNRRVGVCGSYVMCIDENGSKRQVVAYPATDTGIRAFAFFQSPFCHPAVIIRRQTLENYRLSYPAEYYCAEDYGLWVDLLRHSQVANIPEVLLYYRKHGKSETSVSESRVKEKLHTLSRIKSRYLRQNGIIMEGKWMPVFAAFTDRSIPCKWTKSDREKTGKTISLFLDELSCIEDKGRLANETRFQLSIVCFYKFFSTRRVPFNHHLFALYLRGGWHYLKRVITKKITI